MGGMNDTTKQCWDAVLAAIAEARTDFADYPRTTRSGRARYHYEQALDAHEDIARAADSALMSEDDLHAVERARHDIGRLRAAVAEGRALASGQ